MLNKSHFCPKKKKKLQQNLSLSLLSKSLCLFPNPTETLSTQAICSRVGNLRPKSLPLSSKNKLLFHFSGNQQIHFVDKTMEGILFSLVFQDTFGRRLRTTTFATFAFADANSFADSQSWCIRRSILKAGGQNYNNVFRQKKMNSSLFLFISGRRNVAVSQKELYF